MSYITISDFGVGSKAQSNPLAVCATSTLDSSFNGTLGGNNISGPDNQQCQIFMGNYCAANWDGVCEYMSKDQARIYPSVVLAGNGPQGNYLGDGMGSLLTKGQLLIRNAAAEKYLKAMSGNCVRKYEPFDPTVADSPLISRWVQKPLETSDEQMATVLSDKCIPIYGVDPAVIDSDIVMNKILAQPYIAMDILVNIFNNAVRDGSIKKLEKTKLYKLFSNPDFQSIAKSGMYNTY